MRLDKYYNQVKKKFGALVSGWGNAESGPWSLKRYGPAWEDAGTNLTWGQPGQGGHPRTSIHVTMRVMRPFYNNGVKIRVPSHGMLSLFSTDIFFWQLESILVARENAGFREDEKESSCSNQLSVFLPLKPSHRKKNIWLWDQRSKILFWDCRWWPEGEFNVYPPCVRRF